jgi:hypothetical protein
MLSNFTLHDIFASALAFGLFPLVIIFPGYVTGWLLNLFDFRQRTRLTQLTIGLCLSFAVSPIVLYLTSSLVSQNLSLLILGGFAVAAIGVLIKDRRAFTPMEKRHLKTILWLVVAWMVFVILSLVEIEWNGRSFFSVSSYDQATRVSIIEAMTRTGVPPINPSYYPGHPVKLTFLYYFWYILGSYVDILGGKSVDAFAALNASSAWAGLGLMAVVALYLKQRNARYGESAWRSTRIGIGLLAVSGLDVLPAILLMLRTGAILGSVDVWNTWITAWVSSCLWVPHHIAALVAGLVAMMLAQSARGKSTRQQFIILAVAGLAFASALGLSVYVTLIFVLFWAAWLVTLLLQKSERGLILPMIFAGFVALLLASPFLFGLLRGAGEGNAQFPIIFEVRSFLQLESFVNAWPPLARSLVMLAVLPINYLLELGFFFVAGLHWLNTKGWRAIRSNPFFLAESLLLAAAFLVGSFLRSTLITSNDLGWRAWLPGQFILLIWGVDVLESFTVTATLPAEELKTKKLLRVFLALGLLTTLLDAVLLRSAWPIMTGEEVTQRYFAARPAYEYLRQQLPADAITQNNPIDPLNPDRPSGLYGTHQMIVADRTAYGVPPDDLRKLSDAIGALFADANITTWETVDHVCRAYQIDVLIVNDADPFWNSLTLLKTQRAALFQNSRYAIFACGNFAQTR